jgi:hypothetical protein
MADFEHRTENDTDLHGDPDARHWAERFCTKFRVTRQTDWPDSEPMSDDLMHTWFAAAIETGRMHAPPALNVSEAVLAFLRHIVGETSHEEAVREVEATKYSGDLNSAYIADLVLTASEILSTQGFGA